MISLGRIFADSCLRWHRFGPDLHFQASATVQIRPCMVLGMSYILLVSLVSLAKRIRQARKAEGQGYCWRSDDSTTGLF